MCMAGLHVIAGLVAKRAEVALGFMAPLMSLTNSDLVFLLLILAVFLLVLWHIPAMLLKVLSLLAVFCAACVVFLIVTTG